MLESHVIQMKDFENVGEGTSTGFQVSVRCPYYRGIWASLLEGAEVTVDLEANTVSTDGVTANFTIDAFYRDCLLNGEDEIALTLKSEPQIAAYESKRPSFLPTIS